MFGFSNQISLIKDEPVLGRRNDYNLNEQYQPPNLSPITFGSLSSNTLAYTNEFHPSPSVNHYPNNFGYPATPGTEPMKKKRGRPFSGLPTKRQRKQAEKGKAAGQ